jgi:hypothetical protein
MLAAAALLFAQPDAALTQTAGVAAFGKLSGGERRARC